ncbi:hypothetical protein VNO78_33323 [Psophocarpus tetragonolobus]|uniref:Peroxidase n=1 Tax=Psophocarpus tetragonolobus TaxID=3891 RepID=A0AAN9NWS6_PSOTE
MKITTILNFMFFFPFTFADLNIGFYSSTCPRAEAIVSDVVQRHFNMDNSIVGAMLRMHFHDCFVRGCDASILIDPTSTRTSEKLAGPNRSVRGYEIIDEAKAILEKTCPLTVSCADIIALATRDAVSLAGGIRYSVPTGRKDGLLSDPSLVNLPGPSLSVQNALQFFTAKGLTLQDMVTLLGAHTVGFAHCSLFQERLSLVHGKADPTMDPKLRATLVQICDNGSKKSDPRVFLDQNTSFLFDNEFYMEVMKKRGVLHLDQQLALDPLTKDMVEEFAANGWMFQEKFANAMVKLGNIGVVLGGKDGDVRRNCRAFNFPL